MVRLGHLLGCFAAWIAAASLALPLVAADRPKLVVAMSVDQLCQDYLIRFHDNLAEDGGFRRIEREGAAYGNCHHRHAYTITGPGHAVQMTGAYPSTHGIVGNNWFERSSGKDVYCCDDASVQLVGLPDMKGMSPRRLLSDTIGDVLKLTTNGQAKVFGVAIKDRASILMAGHNANAAFWLEDGLWTTSTYYRPDMPGYLRVLNEPRSTERFRGQTWDLLLAKEKYHNKGPDKNTWENPPKGFTSEFPHKLPGHGDLKPGPFSDLAVFTPFGNEVTLAGAREVIFGEQLGQDDVPDLLCINLSSTDYVGHAFGPHSLEVEDMFYRTDRQLGEFFRWLDATVGRGQWSFVLTADHAVAPIVEYAQQMRLPAKRNPLGKTADVKARLEALLHKHLQVEAAKDTPPLVQKVEENQVYLLHEHPLLAAGDRRAQAERVVRDWLLAQSDVAAAFTRSDLLKSGEGKLFQQLQRSFHPRMSGDVLFVLAPYCVPGARGTTHGSPWHYDTHVPLLLLGAGVKNGQFSRAVSPACVAPTIAALLGISSPGGTAEEPLREALN